MSILDSNLFAVLEDQFIISNSNSNSNSHSDVADTSDPNPTTQTFFPTNILIMLYRQPLSTNIQSPPFTFKVVYGLFSFSSDWISKVSLLSDFSFKNFDQFNILLQNFSPYPQSPTSPKIYFPQYSTNQVFINSFDNNLALTQTISLLPPSQLANRQFYYGNPVSDFGFSFSTPSSFDSPLHVFDADFYLSQLQLIYDSPDIKSVFAYDSLKRQFSKTPILLKKNNILYISIYNNSVLPFYLDSSSFQNKTLLFLSISDPNLLYDYSQWSSTVFKTSLLNSTQIFNHFFPTIQFIFSSDLHFSNHYQARWLLKLFNIHYLYNQYYFDLQGSLSFQNLSFDQFPQISFLQPQSGFNQLYQKHFFYTQSPLYHLFHLEFFSDLQFLSIFSSEQLNITDLLSQFPQLLFRFFHDPVPTQSPVPILIQKDAQLTPDEILEEIFGIVEFDQLSSNYIFSDSTNALVSDPLNDLRIQQIKQKNSTKFQFILYFQDILNFPFTIDQLLLIFNYEQHLTSFNNKLKNISIDYAKNLQKLQKILPASKIKALVYYLSLFLLVSIPSFNIFLTFSKKSKSSKIHPLLLKNFSISTIDFASSIPQLQLIKKIGHLQLSDFLFSELQSFDDSYSFLEQIHIIQPPSQPLQFQFFKPPLFSSSTLKDSTFNHINFSSQSPLFPFYFDISSLFQLHSSVHQTRQPFPYFFDYFQNSLNSRPQKYQYIHFSPFSDFKQSQDSSQKQTPGSPPGPTSFTLPTPFNHDSILTSSTTNRNNQLFYTILNLFNILGKSTQQSFKLLFSDLNPSIPTPSKEKNSLLSKFIRFKLSFIIQKFSVYSSNSNPSSYIDSVIEDNIHIFDDPFILYNQTFLSSFSHIQNFDFSDFSYLELVYILLKSIVLYVHLVDFPTSPDIPSLINIHNQSDQFQEHSTFLTINQSLLSKVSIVVNCIFHSLDQQFHFNLIDHSALTNILEYQRENNKIFRLNVSRKLSEFQQKQLQLGVSTLDDFVQSTFYETDPNLDLDQEQPPLLDDVEELDDYYQDDDQLSDDDNLDQYNQNYDE